MSSWFDKLLEELQRRQAEADAQREGRPFEPREGEPRNVTPIDEGRRGRRRTGGNGANGGTGGDGSGRGNGGGRTFPPVAGGDVPWRRYLVIGGGFFVLRGSEERRVGGAGEGRQ